MNRLKAQSYKYKRRLAWIMREIVHNYYSYETIMVNYFNNFRQVHGNC